MFKRYAGLSESSTKVFLDKGIKITNECKRLPIAIAVIASSLKGEQRRDEWDVGLKSLQKHMSIHGVDDELAKIYKCLKFSYDNMKDEKAKSLFLLCSVFREDEDILIERLVRLAIGGGLFGDDYGSYENARNQVVISKNKLLDSCLLLEPDPLRVKMHDLVRDAAQWIGNKEIQTIRVSDKNQKAMVEREKNIKYLSCEGNPKDVFSCKLDGSKLEILIGIMNRDGSRLVKEIEIPNSVFKNNTSLRVFYLLGNIDSVISLSLPQSIQSLKNIRSLIFTYDCLGDISILGNLQSLETLDLNLCTIDELPSGITKLEKFRLLKLEWCRITRNNPFEVIGKCSSLQELYFVGGFDKYCQEITFPKLQRFYVTYNDDYSLSSKFVSIVYKTSLFLSETTLKFCMQEAEDLKLSRIEGEWRNIIPEIVPLDHGMNDIVVLHLVWISQLQCLVDTKHTYSQVSHVFSKLVELILVGMKNMEELCNGPLSFDSFKSLEKLFILNCKQLRSLFKCNLNLCNLKKVFLNRCPMLISLFELSTARSLVLLEILEIVNCEHLKYILTDERKGEGLEGKIIDKDRRSRDPMFLKLKVLVIERCPNFEIILPFVSAHDLPALESITMRSCENLKYIFGKDAKLGSLKNIELNDVPNLIDIFPECCHTMSLSIERSSSISRSASKPSTQSDPIKRNIFSWTSMYCCGKKYENKLRSTSSTKIPLVYENQPGERNLMESNSYCLNINIWERAQCLSRHSHMLCNIKKIELTELRKIKSVCILSIAPRMLLETLRIKDCDELKHIIIDTRDHDDNTGGINLGNVFPKLKELYIENCIQLEYIFGHHTDDHQNHPKIHIHLLALECLHLFNLSSFVDMSSKQYNTTFHKLKDFGLNNCPQVTNVKYIRDFITLDTIIQELSGNMECLLAMERLMLNKFNVESLFCVNEVNEHQINSMLQKIKLEDFYLMTCLFVGPKNYFALLNLKSIKIVRCQKLQVIFSDSILRCLPQLLDIMIIECDELKHIIEDDLENKEMSNSSSSTMTCFPKLQVLVVEKCNKLKCVFPISICNELPELKCLIIREVDELEEIFNSEGEEIQKIKIPNLKFVAFVNLPSLFQTQGIQFQTVEHYCVMACQKLSFTLAWFPDNLMETFGCDVYTLFDTETIENLKSLFQQLQEKYKARDIGTKKDAAANEIEATSEHELISSQIKMKQTPEKEHEFVQDVPNLQIRSESINEELTSQKCTMNQQYPLGESDTTVIPSQENNGIKICVEEGTTTTNAKTKSSSQEDDDSQIALNTISTTMTKTNDQGDPSQNVEDLSSSLLVKRELEQLVSKNYLDNDNLSLLTDFLVKHPSVLLRDTSLSNRYKGYAYNCLAELLKFLRTHSVLDVSGSSHFEFVELLQDVRRFPFDKEWLNVVEKLILFHDLQISQAALQKLLDSKHILNEHVKDLKHQLTSSEAVLENITQQEAHILETRAALSDPIGY